MLSGNCCSTVTLKDFYPVNKWREDSSLFQWGGYNSEPEHIIDLSTNRKYWNEPKKIIRIKCALLAIGTPLVHSIASPINMIYRIVNILSLHHFSNDEYHYHSRGFKSELKRIGR